MRSTSRSVFIITTLFLITLGFTGFLVSGRVYAFCEKYACEKHEDCPGRCGCTAPGTCTWTEECERCNEACGDVNECGSCGSVAPCGGTPSTCSGITFTVAPLSPAPNTAVTVNMSRAGATSCSGNWNNVGLKLDGVTQGISLCYADGTNCGKGYHSDIDSGASGTHTLQFTVNNGSCACNSTTFTTTTPGKLSVRAYVGLDWNFTPGFTAPACNFEGYTDTCSAPYRKFRKNLACRPDGSGIASAGNILLVGCRTVDCGIVDWSSNAINWPQVCAVGVGCTAEILDSFRIDHGTPSIANLSTTKYYAQGYKIFYKQDSSCQNFNVCINAADTPSFGSVNGSPVWHHYRFFWANPASDVKIPSFYLPHYGCPVPVDGGWAEWGPCSGTCGQTGTQTRACTNPSPKDGGKECLFEDGVTRGLTETRACTTPLCLCNAVCTGDAQCASGDCGSVAVGLCGCDDGDVCTADTCNVDGTCTHTPTPVNASWVLGTPGACSIPCGLGGTKLTSYVCNGISSCGGSPVCDPATKPADNISACDAADLCSCNGQCTGNEDCASPFECVGNVCKDPASAAFTWTGCNVANPASWGSCLGGTCGVPNSGTQTCTTASCPATCGGTCGPIPVKSCTPLACGLTSPCELVVGFSTASGSQCKSIKVNSQGLIYDGGRVICP